MDSYNESNDIAIDDLICTVVSSFSTNIEKISNLKDFIKNNGNYKLTKASILLDELMLAEAEQRFLHKKAEIIQQQYRHVISSRLKRELQALYRELAERW